MNTSRQWDDQERQLKALHIFEERPSPTQRELSQNLNLSLGKINFLVQSLIHQGFVKVERFKNSKRKSAYLYYLTPRGFEQKTLLTKNFLKRKMEEYERLKWEIHSLKRSLDEKTAH